MTPAQADYLFFSALFCVGLECFFCTSINIAGDEEMVRMVWLYNGMRGMERTRGTADRWLGIPEMSQLSSLSRKKNKSVANVFHKEEALQDKDWISILFFFPHRLECRVSRIGTRPATSARVRVLESALRAAELACFLFFLRNRREIGREESTSQNVCLLVF